MGVFVTRRVVILVLLLGLGVFFAPLSQAGGGPESTLVIANADSPLSLRLANEYMALRKIPRSHLLRLGKMPNLKVISVDKFRTLIGEPLAAFLFENDLQASVDTIAYSLGFPFGVKFDDDMKKENPDKRVPRVASLNSMTYLLRHVLAKDTDYPSLTVNKYFRGENGLPSGAPAHGFRSQTLWDRNGRATKREHDDDMDSYYLSTLLGFGHTQGTSYPETMHYLTRAIEADGTHPKGRVYYMVNNNVRSKCRQPAFAGAIKHLKAVKRKGEELEKGAGGQNGIVPQGKKDVMGLVAGSASFKWHESSVLLPGSIAEHLTSFGGRLDGSGQTKLTAFLRAGAAGSSGTVAEPLALWQKFPTPYIHGFYARGCSLAESFYQSVRGPYQLLIVGEPLARPFAHFKDVTVAPSLDADTPWTKTVTLKVSATDAKKTPDRAKGVKVFELWIDGRLHSSVDTSDSDSDDGDGSSALISLDTTAMADGHHDVTVVAIEDSDVATRSSTSFAVSFANGTSAVTCKTNSDTVELDETITLTGTAGDVDAIEVRDGFRLLKRINKKGGGWRIKVPAQDVGLGPVSFHAMGLKKDKVVVRSAPVHVLVEPTSLRKPKRVKIPKKRGKKRKSTLKKKGKKTKAPKKGSGLVAMVAPRAGDTVVLTVDRLGSTKGKTFAKLIAAACKDPIQEIAIYGEVEFKEDGQYEWVIAANGTLDINLDGKTLVEDLVCDGTSVRFVWSHLKAGWHGLELIYKPKGAPTLDIGIGGDQVYAPLAGKALRNK